MAKPAIPGRVKTRLTPALSALDAAWAHAAMMQCVLERVSEVFGSQVAAGGCSLVLALDMPVADLDRWPAEAQAVAIPSGWRRMAQGAGDLGERIGRVWAGIGSGPAMFLGVDSPDVPADMLQQAATALARADAAIGPAIDGGYWTLAANRLEPALLAGIDWGSANVYDQTCSAARRAGLRIAELSRWHDVDHPADLAALRERLATRAGPAGTGGEHHGPARPAPGGRALDQLRLRLDTLCRGLEIMTRSPDTNTSTAPATPGVSPGVSPRVFPGVAPGVAPGAAPAEPAMDLSQSVILIVDDNEQNVELLQAYLEVLPCRILTAHDGIAAMKIIEDHDQPTPDLILLDIMMPRMSGFEVCQKIKEDPATRSIPVMMVTALNELGDIERGVDCGTDDFLTKPVNKLELITRVKSLLRVRHLKRELDRTMAYIQDIESRDHPGDSPIVDDMTDLDEGPVG